jgi:hypothetical protein
MTVFLKIKKNRHFVNQFSKIYENKDDPFTNRCAINISRNFINTLFVC